MHERICDVDERTAAVVGGKARVITGAVIVAAAVLCVACFVCCQVGSADRDGDSPLPAALESAGYQGDVDGFIEALTDEQAAELDIAYEADSASGYAGAKEDWIREKLQARIDGNGDIVVLLLDGGEFTVSSGESAANELASAGVDGGGAQTGGGGESGEATSENGSGESESIDAAFGARIVVESVEAHAGDDDVALAIRIENNPGILGLTLALSYDESALTLKSAENGDAFRDDLTLTHSPTYETGCIFTWDGVELASEDAKDGAILNLRFDVSDDAEKGSYPVVVNGGESALTGDLQEASVAVSNGSVVIE